jgi:hypothetical protein
MRFPEDRVRAEAGISPVQNTSWADGLEFVGDDDLSELNADI